jgi:hypothetical protein
MSVHIGHASRGLALVLTLLVSVSIPTALAGQQPVDPPPPDQPQILMAGQPAEIEELSVPISSGVQGALTDSLAAPNRPSGMDYDPANNQLLMVSEAAGALYVIDPDTGATLRTVPLPGASDSDPGSYGIAVVGKYWWHSDYQRGELYQLDPSTGAILATRPMPVRYFGIAWDGSNLWGVDPGKIGEPDSGRLYRIDLRTGDILETVPLPDIAAPIDVTWDGSSLWVAERDRADLHRIDARGHILQTETYPGPSPDGGGLAAHNPDIWVGNYLANTLQRVDLALAACVTPSGLDVCALRPGDILLKTGPKTGDCGRRYRAVYNLGGTYFTHSALYLGKVADPYGNIGPRIAEARGPAEDDADEVWETWLSDTQFATGTCVTDWAVVRPNASAEAIQGAIAYARRKAAEDGVVFDIYASKGDPKKFYCSKLVWKSYLEGSPGGPDLEADRGLGSLVFGAWWVTPDDLYYSSPVVQEMPVSAGQARKRGFFYIWSQGQLTFMDPEGRWVEYDPATGSVLGETAEPAGFALPGVEAEPIAPLAVEAEVLAPPDLEAAPIAPPAVEAEAITAPPGDEAEILAPPDLEAAPIAPPALEAEAVTAPPGEEAEILAPPGVEAEAITALGGEEQTPTCRHRPRHGWFHPRERACR